MRRTYIVGVALVACVAFGAVASSAWALETVWLVNGVKPLSEVPVRSHFSGVLLVDMGTGADVLCTGTGSGTVGPMVIPERSSFDLQLGVVFTLCVIDAGPCTSLDGAGAVAINLPWLTEVVLLTNGKMLDLILSSGVGAPGYLVECVTALGLVDDACTTENGSSILTNAGSNVNAEFPETLESETEAGNCSIGGKEKGLVAGVEVIETEEVGGTVTVSEA